MTSTTMPYIIGNWKMNLDVESAMALAGAVADIANDAANDVGVGIAIPHLWIPLIASEYSDTNLIFGAQDVSEHDQGAYTGEVSAAMLAPWCAFTIVGHSERRQYHGETDDLVRAKLDAAMAHEMAVLLCVGETQEQRDRGEALDVVCRQLELATGHLEQSRLGSLLIAYEPVWAIGTGNTASPADAQEIAAQLRSWLAGKWGDTASEVPILYGGSVNADNAGAYVALEDIDGALVGGSSLKAEDFLEIVRAALQNR